MDNWNYPWGSWEAAIELDRDLAGAFKCCPPARTKLKTGTRIARFVTPRPTPSDAACLSPWWITMDALERLADSAGRNRNSLSTVGRQDLAVSIDFNKTMSTIFVGQLLTPQLAWCGAAAPQSLLLYGASVGTLLRGGEFQLYVPGLKASDVRQLGSAVAYFVPPVSHFSH